MPNDRETYNAARKDYEERRRGYEAFLERVNQLLADLRRQHAAVLDTLKEAKAFLARANVKEREFRVSDVAAEPAAAEAVGGRAHRATAIGAAAVGGGAVGSAAAAATFASAGALGTASTGAVISSLTGIAAHNATLAFLGGGALAAGGGGMAAGVTLLSGVFALPVVAGIGLGWYLTRPSLDEKTRELHESIAQMAAHEVELSALHDRVQEMLTALRVTEQALKTALRQGRIAEDRSSRMPYCLYTSLASTVLRYCRSIVLLLPQRLCELLHGFANPPAAALYRVVVTAQALGQLLDAPLQAKDCHG